MVVSSRLVSELVVVVVVVVWWTPFFFELKAKKTTNDWDGWEYDKTVSVWKLLVGPPRVGKQRLE